jgi:hypothetical protein
MVALRKSAPARMTLAEFLDWTPPEGTGAAYQLIDGEPVAVAPASLNHAFLVAEIARLIGNHLVDAGSVYNVMMQPGIVHMCVPTGIFAYLISGSLAGADPTN